MRKILIIVFFMVTFIFTVRAQEQMPAEIYLEQAGSRSCTLCSATMMLRSCFYINADDRWEQVTENAVGISAWTSDGMRWSWSYNLEDVTVNVAQQGCSGVTAAQLRQLLDSHPEGIVLYCGGSAPHGVFLTGYSGDTFYCADPAFGYAGGQIPLEESLLGARHGSQDAILRTVSAYWYIASHNIEDRSYISTCREYPMDCTIRVRWDGYAMSLPCTQDHSDESEKVFRIQSGETYTAQAFLLNDAGQRWFCVGEDIYISAQDAQRAAGSTTEHRTQSQSDKQIQVVPLLLSSEIPWKNPTKNIDNSGFCGRITKICKGNAETRRIPDTKARGEWCEPLVNGFSQPLPSRPGGPGRVLPLQSV